MKLRDERIERGENEEGEVREKRKQERQRAKKRQREIERGKISSLDIWMSAAGTIH